MKQIFAVFCLLSISLTAFADMRGLGKPATNYPVNVRTACDGAKAAITNRPCGQLYGPAKDVCMAIKAGKANFCTGLYNTAAEMCQGIKAAIGTNLRCGDLSGLPEATCTAVKALEDNTHCNELGASQAGQICRGFMTGEGSGNCGIYN